MVGLVRGATTNTQIFNRTEFVLYMVSFLEAICAQIQRILHEKFSNTNHDHMKEQIHYILWEIYVFTKVDKYWLHEKI